MAATCVHAICASVAPQAKTTAHREAHQCRSAWPSPGVSFSIGTAREKAAAAQKMMPTGGSDGVRTGAGMSTPTGRGTLKPSKRGLGSHVTQIQ